MEKELKRGGGSYIVWATTAIHQLGDISRPKGDFAQVFREDDDNFYGNWFYGFGFVSVKFPKSTTRRLTNEELDSFRKKGFAIGRETIRDNNDWAETFPE